MKNTLVIFIALLLGNTFANAQTIMDPHHPDNEKLLVTQNLEVDNNEISNAGDVTICEGSKISFHTASAYFYYSAFEKYRTQKIEKWLTKKLGTPDFSNSRLTRWNTLNGQEIENLRITLKRGRVKINYENPNEKTLLAVKKLAEKIDLLSEGTSM